MLNRLWPALLGIAVITAAINGRLAEVTAAILQSGESAIRLCITLGGAMCVWNGLMAVAEKSGITRGIARLMRPLLRLLFPRLSPDGAAARAIAANMTANLLGLGNAATPLGLRAMEELKVTMPAPGVAGDEMVTFVVMNTASLQLFPTTVIALRQAAGAAAPLRILPAVWLASAATFATAVLAAAAFRHPYRGDIP